MGLPNVSGNPGWVRSRAGSGYLCPRTAIQARSVVPYAAPPHPVSLSTKWGSVDSLCFLQVRLQPKGMPDALHCRGRDMPACRSSAHAPVRGVVRFARRTLSAAELNLPVAHTARGGQRVGHRSNSARRYAWQRRRHFETVLALSSLLGNHMPDFLICAAPARRMRSFSSRRSRACACAFASADLCLWRASRPSA